MSMSIGLGIGIGKRGFVPLVPPAGFIFLTDADGALLTDADGFLLIEAI